MAFQAITGLGLQPQTAVQDVYRCVPVPGHDQSAVRTFMHSYGQVLRHQCAAGRADLRRVSRIHEYDGMTSLLHFVYRHPRECIPARIAVRFPHSFRGSLRHLLDGEVLHGYVPVTDGQFPGYLVEHVLPVIPRLLVLVRELAQSLVVILG